MGKYPKCLSLRLREDSYYFTTFWQMMTGKHIL